jgi:hypothetical protein
MTAIVWLSWQLNDADEPVSKLGGLRILKDGPVCLTWSPGYRGGMAETQREPVPRVDSGGWVMAHMTSETARHAGHADILREQLDGTTGR